MEDPQNLGNPRFRKPMSPRSGGPIGGAMSDDGADRGLGSSLECKASQNLSVSWRHTHQMAVLIGPGKINFQILVDIW